MELNNADQDKLRLLRYNHVERSTRCRSRYSVTQVRKDYTRSDMESITQ